MFTHSCTSTWEQRSSTLLGWAKFTNKTSKEKFLEHCLNLTENLLSQFWQISIPSPFSNSSLQDQQHSWFHLHHFPLSHRCPALHHKFPYPKTTESFWTCPWQSPQTLWLLNCSFLSLIATTPLLTYWFWSMNTDSKIIENSHCLFWLKFYRIQVLSAWLLPLTSQLTGLTQTRYDLFIYSVLTPNINSWAKYACFFGEWREKDLR